MLLLSETLPPVVTDIEKYRQHKANNKNKQGHFFNEAGIEINTG